MKDAFGRFASLISGSLASPAATGAAILIVLLWAAFGPITKYSDNWQLLINTGTGIITFLMVFILNNAQARDTSAINAKLDALIVSIERADNRFIGLEKQSVTDAEAICQELGSQTETETLASTAGE